jgi:hypothetical protein
LDAISDLTQAINSNQPQWHCETIGDEELLSEDLLIQLADDLRFFKTISECFNGGGTIEG